MMHWFIWKGKNSIGDFGLWINKLPPIVRASERVTEIQIPGRPGVLTLLEGEDVYNQVVRKCTVIARNNMNLQPILEWLRGEGELTFSNESDKVYFARIAAEVSFSRISNDLSQAQIAFSCQPLKGRIRAANDTVTLDDDGDIFNPGDVISRPSVMVTGSGSTTVTIGEQAMTFTNLSGTIVVDCDAQIITKNGALWQGVFSGDFWTIPKGKVDVDIGSASEVVIEPRWRWV